MEINKRIFRIMNRIYFKIKIFKIKISIQILRIFKKNKNNKIQLISYNLIMMKNLKKNCNNNYKII